MLQRYQRSTDVNGATGAPGVKDETQQTRAENGSRPPGLDTRFVRHKGSFIIGLCIWERAPYPLPNGEFKEQVQGSSAVTVVLASNARTQRVRGDWPGFSPEGRANTAA